MKAGNKITLGEYKWRVLNVQNDKILLLTDKVLEKKQPYHEDYISITWEQCTLRRYLNNEFLNNFNRTDRNKIIESSILNAKNPWFDTDGGVNTFDYVFLLSLDEVVKYFGDIGQLKDKNPDGLWNSAWKDDPYRTKRGVKNLRGSLSWWWLRSPGINTKNNAAYINGTGRVFVGGDSVNRIGGVRPALWVRIE